MAISVTIRDSNIAHALRLLRKRQQTEGTLRVKKKSQYFEPRSARLKREKNEAKRRIYKLMRKTNQNNVTVLPPRI